MQPPDHMIPASFGLCHLSAALTAFACCNQEDGKRGENDKADAAGPSQGLNVNGSLQELQPDEEEGKWAWCTAVAVGISTGCSTTYLFVVVNMLKPLLCVLILLTHGLSSMCI